MTEQGVGSREERVTVSVLYASAEGGGLGNNLADGFTVNGGDAERPLSILSPTFF